MYGLVCIQLNRLRASPSFLSAAYKREQITKALNLLTNAVDMIDENNGSCDFSQITPDVGKHFGAGTIDLEHYRPTMFASAESMLNFSAQAWVIQSEIISEDRTGRTKIITLQAHWERQPSLTQALGCARNNFLNSIFQYFN